MIRITPLERLGHANHGWLDAHHHFSFAEYYDPERMGFGDLRVWNDDTIAAGGGFPTHPHRDMEIITYVRTGAVSHEDSEGNWGETSAGQVQVMSAGRGIRHSEYNEGTVPLTLFQIWIQPNALGLAPRWDAVDVSRDKPDTLQLLVSGRDQDKESGAMFINQDAAFLAANMTAGGQVTYKLDVGRRAYVVSGKGEISINGQLAPARAGTEIEDETEITIDAPDGAEVALLDLP